ncbi:hypothetical protein SDC9_80490 [bioreactor metagenome]|uniref:Uncharacterized protein n=1 Tax=bioreactor metagenome TaxID=1076179 RepID=A0A644Z044_9ZZZZ
MHDFASCSAGLIAVPLRRIAVGGVGALPENFVGDFGIGRGGDHIAGMTVGPGGVEPAGMHGMGFIAGSHRRIIIENVDVSPNRAAGRIGQIALVPILGGGYGLGAVGKDDGIRGIGDLSRFRRPLGVADIAGAGGDVIDVDAVVAAGIGEPLSQRLGRAHQRRLGNVVVVDDVARPPLAAVAAGGARRGEGTVVVIGVHDHAQHQLFDITQTVGAPCAFPRRRQRRQQHRRQNGDDRNHNQQFYQCESYSFLHRFFLPFP